MAQATTNPEQKTNRPPPQPQRVAAARAYQKTHLTEVAEEELLVNYAPVISQMAHRFAPLVQVSGDEAPTAATKVASKGGTRP